MVVHGSAVLAVPIGVGTGLVMLAFVATFRRSLFEAYESPDGSEGPAGDHVAADSGPPSVASGHGTGAALQIGARLSERMGACTKAVVNSARELPRQVVRMASAAANAVADAASAAVEVANAGVNATVVRARGSRREAQDRPVPNARRSAEIASARAAQQMLDGSDLAAADDNSAAAHDGSAAAAARLAARKGDAPDVKKGDENAAAAQRGPLLKHPLRKAKLKRSDSVLLQGFDIDESSDKTVAEQVCPPARALHSFRLELPSRYAVENRARQELRAHHRPFPPMGRRRQRTYNSR